MIFEAASTLSGVLSKNNSSARSLSDITVKSISKSSTKVSPSTFISSLTPALFWYSSASSFPFSIASSSDCKLKIAKGTIL